MVGIDMIKRKWYLHDIDSISNGGWWYRHSEIEIDSLPISSLDCRYRHGGIEIDSLPISSQNRILIVDIDMGKSESIAYRYRILMVDIDMIKRKWFLHDIDSISNGGWWYRLGELEINSLLISSLDCRYRHGEVEIDSLPISIRNRILIVIDMG